MIAHAGFAVMALMLPLSLWRWLLETAAEEFDYWWIITSNFIALYNLESIFTYDRLLDFRNNSMGM